MDMKAAEPRKRAPEPGVNFFLPIPLAASPLVFAAPLLKLPQNRQLDKEVNRHFLTNEYGDLSFFLLFLIEP